MAAGAQALRERRPRDPRATREAILGAARSRLAVDGPEGLSLSEVAHQAGVNRGTAYQHFETREKLVAATLEWVSEALYRAVFDPQETGEEPVEETDTAALTDRIATFVMANRDLCRVWFLQVLASPAWRDDLFLRAYQERFAAFAASDRAEPGIDVEVGSAIMLAGIFLWPLWSHPADEADAARQSRRFADECLRLSMYGTMRSERHPDVAERLERRTAKPSNRS